jgi:hypothetical protein
MRAIYKYRIEFVRTTLTLPIGAKFVHFAEQGGEMCAWFEIDNDVARAKQRTFTIYGTGQLHKIEGRHLGTAQDGVFVWHLYEVTA